MDEKVKELYLAHHGVKGQKWGIRRYQNEDGTLTAEGRAKYGVNDQLTGNYRKDKKTAKKLGMETLFSKERTMEYRQRDLRKEGNSTYGEMAKSSEEYHKSLQKAAKKYMENFQNTYGSKKIKDLDRAVTDKALNIFQRARYIYPNQHRFAWLGLEGQIYGGIKDIRKRKDYDNKMRV